MGVAVGNSEEEFVGVKDGKLLCPMLGDVVGVRVGNLKGNLVGNSLFRLVGLLVSDIVVC